MMMSGMVLGLLLLLLVVGIALLLLIGGGVLVWSNRSGSRSSVGGGRHSWVKHPARYSTDDWQPARSMRTNIARF